MKRTVIAVLAFILLMAAGTLALATLRWRRGTNALVEQLSAGDAPEGRPFTMADLEGLPAPVARYFRAVLREGQPLVRGVRLTQEGDFLVQPTADGWRPFTARHWAVAVPPGFIWDARIRMGPGLSVRVRDGFVGGRGSMRASVLGLVSMVDVQGTAEMASGALHRYLAEAAWCPTALLPSQGVVWDAMDDSTARATLRVGSTSVSLEVRFGPDSLIRSVYAPDRARDVNGRGVPTPWQGRWFEYAERGGMRIPMRGEVEWLLPEGPQVYWRGRVTSVEYGSPSPR